MDPQDQLQFLLSFLIGPPKPTARTSVKTFFTSSHFYILLLLETFHIKPHNPSFYFVRGLRPDFMRDKHLCNIDHKAEDFLNPPKSQGSKSSDTEVGTNEKIVNFFASG